MSDLHLEYGRFEFDRNLDFDVAVLAGDIHQPGELGVHWALMSEALKAKPVLIVPGNHEFHRARMDSAMSAMRSMAAGSHVHILNEDEFHIAKVRFLGATLWTDFALAIDTPRGLLVDVELASRLSELALDDFRWIRLPNHQALHSDTAALDGRTFRARDAQNFHHQQCRWLKERLQTPFDGKTVVITHHAPHRGSLAHWYAEDWISAAYVSDLPREFFSVPALWVHGHTHTSFDYQVGSCRILCNPRGCMRMSGANIQFNPCLVVTV